MAKNKGDFFFRLSAYHNEVTGSRFVIYCKRPGEEPMYIGIDRGFVQEHNYQELNYLNEFDDSKLDALIITHNHIDHQGMVPFAVKNGYCNKIYMTSVTSKLVYPFWVDAASHHDENAKMLREKYKTGKIPVLYDIDDVQKAMNLIQPYEYLETNEILPGVKLTFLDNGHLFGAAMVLLQIHAYGRKSINLLFTGDYKPEIEWKKVIPIPDWVKLDDLIVVCEATYGNTMKSQIEECFEANIVKAISERKNILIPAFAQGRKQSILYKLKLMQEEGKIPYAYDICIDGSLGITTTMRYQTLLKEINPEMKDFMPSDVTMVDAESRLDFATRKIPTILLTTSGMVSQGPARFYAEHMLGNPNVLIHLCGYAAEGTLARSLLEAENGEFVKFSGRKVKKKCEIKTTGEFSAHAPLDELIALLDDLNEFGNVKYVFINHGSFGAKYMFQEYASENSSIGRDNIFQIDRSVVFTIYQEGFEGDNFNTLRVKSFSSKLEKNLAEAFIKKYTGKRENNFSENVKKKKKKKTSRKTNYNNKRYSKKATKKMYKR